MLMLRQQVLSCVKKLPCQKLGMALLLPYLNNCITAQQHSANEEAKGPTAAADGASSERNALKLRINQVCPCRVCAPADLVSPAPAV